MSITDIGRNVNTIPTQTANYSVQVGDEQVPMNATSGSLTATLYPAVGDGALHQVVVYKTDSSANTVTVSAADGFSFIMSNQNDAVTCQQTTAGVWIATGASDTTGEANQSTNISTANSAGVSGGLRASVADSKAVSDSVVISTLTTTTSSNAASNSLNVSVADSKAVSDSVVISTLTTTTSSAAASNSVNTSTADSKAVSDSVITSTLTTTTNSAITSVALKLSITTSTANS